MIVVTMTTTTITTIITATTITVEMSVNGANDGSGVLFRRRSDVTMIEVLLSLSLVI